MTPGRARLENIMIKGTRFILGQDAVRFVALTEQFRRCLHRRGL
jgi:hypothetical protein